MGVVAVRAFPFPNRLVDNMLGKFGLFVMTGITKVLNFLLEQSVIARHMRAVTGETFPSRRWFMLHPFLKRVSVMT